MIDFLTLFWQTTGLSQITPGDVLVMGGAGLLLYAALVRGLEPVFLVPFAFAALLASIPGGGVVAPGGVLHDLYRFGLGDGIFPALLLFGLGTLMDFGPLLAMPSLVFLGMAAQAGIFVTVYGVIALNAALGLDFGWADTASVAMLGGASAPIVLFFSAHLSPDLLAAIAVAIYGSVALLPVLQPLIIRLLTTQEERQIVMLSLPDVSQRAKIAFPVVLLVLCLLFLPTALPLLGMVALGNFLKESGLLARLMPVKTAQIHFIPFVTFLLGLAAGSQLSAESFFSGKTVVIIVLGIVAIVIGTAVGILTGKLFCLIGNGKINPLIGAAGIAIMPLSARIVNKLGLEEKSDSMLLTHAVGVTMAGVIGSAVVAGTFLAIFGGK